jgi:capsular exopolysaccharide synthesis family protein
MGRIDRALSHTNVEHDPDATVIETEPGSAPRSEVFISPWTFAEDDPQEQADVKTGARSAPGSPAPIKPAGPPSMGVSQGISGHMAARLVTAPDAPPHLVEPFRRLAATLHHAQLTSGTKAVMVTSASPADGKSFTSANLALTLSESYRRNVLLIDADLRRPSLHYVFGVPNVSGLNEGIKAGPDTKLAAIAITPTLTLLPAGRPDPDPMSSLTSTRMREILIEAVERFDWVIIDTAPVGLLADAGILGGMVDATLLVVAAGQTSHAVVEKAVERFGRERILGVVLNSTELEPGEPAYAGYASTALAK